MDHIEGAASRPVQDAVGPGLVRGALCGAVAGALSGAGLVVWISVAPSPLESGAPFSVLVMAYGALIGVMLGAVVGFLAAAASLAVLAVGGARRGWAVSVVAALVAALVSSVVLNVAAQRADGVLLSAAQTVVVGVGSAAIALWQVRGLVRRLDR
jgi:hypothetical protein